MVMPMFFQMQFRSDWLCYKPFSYEKRIMGIDYDIIPVKEWKSHQLPTLFTPVNSSRILQTKRLVVLIKLAEGKAEVSENFAYCLLQFQGIQHLEGKKYAKKFRGDVIGYNTKIGDYECEVVYEVIGNQDLIQEIVLKETVA